MVAPSFLKIFVADLDRAQAFYGAVFELEERARFSTPHFDERILISGQSGQGVALVICRRPDGGAPILGDAYGPIGFRTKTVDALHAAAIAAGGAELMAPRDVGPARVSMVADPDGHPIELLATA